MQHGSTKNAFWDVNNKKWRKWCKFVPHFLFNNTCGLPVVTMDTKCPNRVFFVWFVDLHTICAKQRLQTLVAPNNDNRVCLLVIKHSWTLKAFGDVNYKKWRKWWKYVSPFLFNNIYSLNVLTSVTERPKQVFYVCWSIYGLLVLNRGCWRDSLHMMILINVCGTWSMGDRKTRFQTGKKELT
jgi:hypothetical protein